MHSCPDCGQACCCNGDIEDCNMSIGGDEEMDCDHYLQCEKEVDVMDYDDEYEVAP